MAKYNFRQLSRADHRDLCAKGGRAAQASGRAHRWTAEEAAVAGRKGGQAKRPKRPTSQQGRLA